MFTRKSRARLVLLTSASFLFALPTFAQEADPVETPQEEAAEQRTLETVQVRYRYIPDERRSTSEVSSLLDAGDFQLQGDGDAAAALRRVAGVTTSDNKFVYVRGLNERYSSATLNGSPLPSPAPLRRVAPLDLFPTSALSGILVQKTYSPNLPGEFGGGLVDIRTRAVPDDRFLNVSFDISGDTETSFQSGLLYDGSDTDWLGIDDGARDLPGFDLATENYDFGRAFTDDSSLLVMQEGDVAPNFSFGVTAGDVYDLSTDITMGILGSVGYSNEWSTREGIRGQAVRPSINSPEIAAEEQRERRSTQNTVGVNALAVIGLELYQDHEVQFTALGTRSSEKEARTIIGTTEEDAGVFRDDSLEWFERQLWTTQLRGEHVFPNLMDLEVEWRGSYSEAQRDAPFQLSNRYREDANGDFILSSSPAANRIQYSDVQDDTTDFGLDFKLPLQFNGDWFSEVNLLAGYSYVENDRFASVRIFDITGIGGLANANGIRLDYIYSALFNGGPGSVQETGGIQFPEAYIATLETDAAYFQIDTQITPFVRAAIGGRYESAIQAVDTITLNGPSAGNFVEACIERQADQSCDSKEDFLPAATITVTPFQDFQIRFGYSETLTRPQFRELAPTQFVNTETDVSFVGNPFLQNASISNYDIRAEYYFDRGQFLTFGLFYKEMESPIEEVLVSIGNVTNTSFVNVPSAELYGFEVEYEQILPMFDWTNWDFFRDRDFTVKTNYTWSDSEISADGTIAINGGTPTSPVLSTVSAAGRIEDGRQLQGQSEHLFNLQLGLSNNDTGSEMNVLLNYASERIRSGESIADGLPAIIEQPPMTVDFVYSRPVDLGGAEYELSFNASNIFGDDFEAYQQGGGVTVDVDTYSLGPAISFGISREF